MKPKSKASRLIIVVLFLTVISAFSIPLPKTEKTTISGTVMDWTWRGEIDYQVEFEGLAFGQTIPSHYIIRIKVQHKRSELYDTINWYSRLVPIGIGIDGDELKGDEVIVYLPTSRLEGLLSGAKVTIEDYAIAADDTGPVAVSSKILINGAVPKDLGSVFPPNESKKPNKVRSK